MIGSTVGGLVLVFSLCDLEGANLYNDKTSVGAKINKDFQSLREQIEREGRAESKF